MATDFTSQINGYYQAVQFRNAPAADLATYNAGLQNGSLTLAQVQQAIINDPFTVNIANVVIREYQAAFGRVPDQAGLNFWVDAIADGSQSLATLNTVFANSAEFTTRFGANANTPANAALVTSLYTQVYNRAPDAGGLAFYSTGFPKGPDGVTGVPGSTPLTAAQLLNLFANAPEFILQTSAAVTAFEQAEIAGTAPTTGSLFLVAPPGGSDTAQTFTLTVSGPTGLADTLPKFQGGTANDIYNALLPGSLETGDTLNGGAGTDTLNANLAGGGAITPQMTAIENLNLSNLSGAATVLDLTQSAGYTNIQVQNVQTAANSITVQGISSTAAKLAVTNLGSTAVVGNPGGGNAVFQFQNAAVAGSADAADLTVNNVGSATGTAFGTGPAITLQGAGGSTSGVETVNLHVTGATRLSLLDVESTPGGADGMTTLNIDGSANLTIDSVNFKGATGNATIDASKATGNVVITLAGTDNVKFTGGAGSDAIFFGGTFDGQDSVDGGAGRDEIGVDTYAQLQAGIANVKNVEIAGIQLAAAPGTVDFKGTAFDTVDFRAGAAAGTVIVDNFTANGNLIIGDGPGYAGSATGTIQVNEVNATLGSNANDVLNVQLGVTATTAAAGSENFGTIRAPGVETIAITTAGTLNRGTDTLAIDQTDANLKTVTVAGNENLNLTTTGGQTSVTLLDASASKGGIDIAGAGGTTTGGAVTIGFSTSGATIKGGAQANDLAGGTGNDTIIGGAQNDRIDGGLGIGADILTGAAGRDTFVLRTNGNAVNIAAPIVDTITDFALGANADILDFTQVANGVTVNGDVSAQLVTALNGALPTGGTNGQAEVIVLDASVAALQAGNSQALNNLLFNLGGSGGYGNVIVAYSDSATGNVRLAQATIAGGDITAVTDLAVLQGVTTAQFAANFAGGGAGGNTVGNVVSTGGIIGAPVIPPIALTAPAAVLSNASQVGATTVTTTGDDAISTSAANAVGSSIDGGAGTDTVTFTTAPGGAFVIGTGAGAGGLTLQNVEVVTLSAGGSVSIANGSSTGGANALTTVNASAATTILMNTNPGLRFNGSTGNDTVTLGAPSQTVNGDAGDDTINATAASLALATISGGTNTVTGDTLALTGGGNFNVATSITGIENVTTDAAGGTITLAAGVTSFTGLGNGATALAVTLVDGVTNLNLQATAGANTINATAAQLTGITTGDLADANVDTFNITTAGAVTLGGWTNSDANNNDVLNFNAGGNAVSVASGSIDDFIFTGTAGANDVINLLTTGTNDFSANAGHLVAIDTINGTAGNDTITVDQATGLTVNGGGGNDTLITTNGSSATLRGDAGNDTLAGRDGRDTFTGGADADNFTISAFAANGADRKTVTDFTVGAGGDVFNVEAAAGGITGVALTGTDNFGSTNSVQAVAATGNLAVTAAAEVVRFTGAQLASNVFTAATANDLNGTNLLAAIGGTITGAIAGQNDILIAIGDTAGNTAIYYASSADNAIIASEITLVGVLQTTAVGGLTVSNFNNLNLV